jgi:hypothetical protein
VLRAVKGASDAGKGGKGLGCSMVNVRLPIRITNLDLNSGKKDKVINVRPEEVSPLAHWLHEQLIARSTFVPCFPHGEWMFVRLSAQVYLERSDFVWLGDVLKDIMEGVTGFLERNKNGTQAKAKI